MLSIHLLEQIYQSEIKVNDTIIRQPGSVSRIILSAALPITAQVIADISCLLIIPDEIEDNNKLKIQKALSTRPAKMRRTYLPAVGVCIIMILYVLIVFVKNQLNILF